MNHHPREEYARRLESRRQSVANHLRKEQRIGLARLLAFLSGLVLLIAVLGQVEIPSLLVLAPFVLFFGLLVLHDRLIRKRRKLEQAVRFYEMEIARIDHTWMGKGPEGLRFAPEKHPYSVDLDLFGKGSLFEYLCRARTPTGQRKLAGWLLNKGAVPELRERQEAVRELAPNLDFREALAQDANREGTLHDPSYFEDWMKMPPVVFRPIEKGIALLLSLASILTLTAWFGTDLGGLPFLASCVISGLFFLLLSGRVSRVLGSATRISEGLDQYATLLECVENENFSCAYLKRLKDRLEKEGTPASREIRRLGRWVKKLEDGNRNVILFPFARLLFWSTHLAMSIEKWREDHGTGVLEWIDALAEFEALSSLGAHAYANPDNTFPCFEEESRILEGTGLGHPLMDRAQCVRNDVHLGEDTPLLIISGSNMSGKSTYMRTVGINTVLALAGGTVHASGFRVSLFRVAASIQIRDSLQEGISKFYQEILRVREMIEMSGQGEPLLFLIDEIFQGTNSHDRRIAAQSIMKKLVNQGALGLISTHDLALTQIAENLHPPGRNLHFEDRMEDGKMVFDYRIREGVVQKGNALHLLRSIGLEIEEE